MLGEFFTINMPYGMQCNEKDEWTFFNREYVPLGFNDRGSKYGLSYQLTLPIWTKYKGLTEKKLLSFAHGEGEDGGVARDNNGKICKVWFYHDGITPADFTRKTVKGTAVWSKYFDIIERLSTLKQQTEV